MSIRSFAPSRARRICGILVGLVLAPAAIGQTTITAPYNPDSDADSVIAILDLMSVLSIYGDAFEPAPIMIDGITLEEYLAVLEQGASCVVGCQDETACNYDSTATVGIACTCDYISCLGCTPVTFDGHTYEVVEIGTQCWFAENLRTTVYADGTTIPANLSNAQWTSTTSGATTVYGEGGFYCDGSCDANLEAFGRLYNWYAVDDSRGLCPTGWHVPTAGEWMDLTDELGGVYLAGTAMKSSAIDYPSWDGANTSGFSALPGGWREYYNGSFEREGDMGHWWSASLSGSSDPWLWYLQSYYYGVSDDTLDHRYGLSVRCLKDE